MHLAEREKEDLLMVVTAWLAKERMAKGMKLSYPEAVAYISVEVMEQARMGTMSVSDLQEYGKTILSEDDLMDGVSALMSKINAYATFPDGTKIIVIYDPIKPPKAPELGEHFEQNGD